MGCICSKQSTQPLVNQNSNKSSLVDTNVHAKKEYLHKTPHGGGGGGGGGVAVAAGRRVVGLARHSSRVNGIPAQSIDGDGKGGPPQLARLYSVPRGGEAELVSAGWPSWLTSVAGEAIKGWVPRRAQSFEKLEKIGQGTYSSVYRAKDLETGKIVAMKKVRFVNMDPESVRFMAREIHILRKLDHPNVMKLEGLVTSRMSGSLYLVFEYMEHDLAGLAAKPGIKFTEAQIKCYMRQLFLGLQHCHDRGILHRDIKGSNLLINNDGVLKIGDFGLANLYRPNGPPLTSRVVTLWYRAPELLLGATDYGTSVDMWSAGCILAELFAGKPIMPGRTEVEQMHKIFKLCGSPSNDYWQKTRLPLATSFKPQHPYPRNLNETFQNFPPTALALVDKLLSMEPERRGSAKLALRNEFFSTEPLPADPSSLPKYSPSKELDAKVRDEEARRRKADAVKGRGPESVRSTRNSKRVQTPEFIGPGKFKGGSANHNKTMEGGTGSRVELRRGATTNNGLSHSTSMVHPSAAGSTWNKGGSSTLYNADPRTQKSQKASVAPDSTNYSQKHRAVSSKDSDTVYLPKKNRIHYSGPLMPAGGNMEDMLKEHERQIQEAVRKSRSGTKDNQTSGIPPPYIKRERP